MHKLMHKLKTAAQVTWGGRRVSYSILIGKLGGARRDRTADLVNAIHALSQLSYGPGQSEPSDLEAATLAVKVLRDAAV